MENISIHIYAGEFVVLGGENGSGKTTLAKHVVGLLRAQDGIILVKGIDMRRLTTAQVAHHVGYLPQNPYLQICTNTTREEVGLALKALKLDKAEIEERVDYWLAKMGLSEVALVHPYKLPGSVVQKIALASRLIHEPDVLIVDEPTSHMSHPDDWKTMELLAQVKDEGRTVIVITHDFDLALSFASRFVLMERGTIKMDLNEEELRSVRPSIVSEIHGTCDFNMCPRSKWNAAR